MLTCSICGKVVKDDEFFEPPFEMTGFLCLECWISERERLNYEFEKE